MIIAPDEGNGAALQRMANKTVARKRVMALLAGTGLKVHALRNELVITNPHDPEKGRIYVEYADGSVSWERTAWSHLGHLRGYEEEVEDFGPCVGKSEILTTLNVVTSESPDPAQTPACAASAHLGSAGRSPE